MTWQERFKNKMLPLENGCIEYQGAITSAGYGFFWRLGSNQYAHRVSWELDNNKPIPDGMCVLHSCDNRTCVNPKHLSLGTYHDNVLDMIAKGRQNIVRGEVRSKISEETAKAIKADLKTNVTLVEIAKKHNTTYGIVKSIRRGIAWSWMDGTNDQQL